ncbi:MAG: PAS domain-containing protein [Shimia sp.]
MRIDDGETVVSMGQYRKDERFAGIAEVEAYWQALRGSRMVPLRSEIDPRGIEQTLDYAFIVERVTAGVARFRLAGGQLNELMGMDVRGMPLTALFATESRETMIAAIQGVFDGPEALECSLESPGGAGRPALSAQMILLPLESDLGDISRAIGVVSSRGEMGRAPRRFTLGGTLHRRPLGYGNVPLPIDGPRPVENAFGDMPITPPTQPRPKAPSGTKPFLRLVKSED